MLIYRILLKILYSLESEVEKLDADKLLPVADDFIKLSD